MSVVLSVKRAGPLMSLQDLGRPGHLGQGLAQGGAMDRLAVMEAAALLGHDTVEAGIEMAGMGGDFTCNAPLRFALTGAPMSARIDGKALRWHATHRLEPGQILSIGGVNAGTYGYLSFGGGIDGPAWLGSRAAHLNIGIGAVLATGDTVPLGTDVRRDQAARMLPVTNRFAGGTVRLTPGPQTDLFDQLTLTRLTETTFRRAAQANRQGVRLDGDSGPFDCAHAAGLVSDFIAPGDVQMTGAGVPYVLMAECQTMGGYPRIGTVIAADLPHVAQAPLGAVLRFVWVDRADADRLFLPVAKVLARLRAEVQPVLQDPAEMHDLLSYQLISGVTAGDDLERDA